MDKRERMKSGSKRSIRTSDNKNRRLRYSEDAKVQGTARKKTVSRENQKDRYVYREEEGMNSRQTRTYRSAEEERKRELERAKRKRAAKRRQLDEQGRRSASSRQTADSNVQKINRTNADRRKKVKRKKKKQRWNRKKIARLIQIVLILALAGGLIYMITNYSEANKLNNKGLDSYNSLDYETANAYFKKAIEKDGSNYEYHMNQAMALSGLKMYGDAMASFERALELAKGDAQIQLVQRSKGISLLYQGSYSQALEAFEAALNGKENHYSEIDKDILYYTAETLDKAGRFVDAVIVYTKIVDAEGTADAYMLRGMEYVKVGDYPSAESDLRTAIKKDKKNYEIYMALYQALSYQNKYDEAKETLEEALKLGGNKGDALVNQGKILMELGDFVTAEEKLLKALDKGAERANLVLAELYMEKPTPDPTTALGYFEAYFVDVTDDAEAYNMYGLCLMELEDFAKAEEVFTMGVALGDRLMDRSISKNQISAAEHAGHWENALNYVEVYLQKYSDDEAAIKEKEFIQTRIR